MNPLLEMARLNKVNEALEILVKAKLLDQVERIRLTRKYLNDRPEFKSAIQESVNRSDRKIIG
jgi:hypothetical protein